MSSKTSYRRQARKNKRDSNKTEAELNFELNSRNFEGKFRKERKATSKRHEEYFKDLQDVDNSRNLGQQND